MQLSEKLLDKPVSELSVKELLSLIGRNEDIQSSAIENEQKLFDDEEWIRGWKDLAKFCDRSVPTVRSWYKQGLLDKATRKIGAFYLFNKEWLRQNLLQMLPENIRKRAEYLSSHFEEKQCRDELHELILNYIKHKNTTHEK